MCLSREDAQLVTAKDWTPSFEKVFAADEANFATVMAACGKSPRQAVANRAITWTEWVEGESHPREFESVSPRIAAQIKESGCFFARKFAPGSDIRRWNLHIGERHEPLDIPGQAGRGDECVGNPVLVSNPPEPVIPHIVFCQTVKGRFGQMRKAVPHNLQVLRKFIAHMRDADLEDLMPLPATFSLAIADIENIQKLAIHCGV